MDEAICQQKAEEYRRLFALARHIRLELEAEGFKLEAQNFKSFTHIPPEDYKFRRVITEVY